MAWTGQTFSVGQILTAAQMNNLQADITAVADGDSGAPRVTPRLAFEEPVAGSVTSSLDPTEYSETGASYVAKTKAKVWANGTVSVKYETKVDINNGDVRIMKNGVQQFTANETSSTYVARSTDVVVSFGDLLSVEIKHNTGASMFVRNFEIAADVKIMAAKTGLEVTA